MNTTRKIFIAVGGLALLVGVFYFFYKTGEGRVNYLIPGVPYYGVYNHFLEADDSQVTAAAMVLGYWGDRRFSLRDLMEKSSRGRFSTTDLKQFFEENGYETYRWVSSSGGGELKQIKQFVNPGKKIPVIVFQKRSPDAGHLTRGMRVIIGVFDKKKKVIVHDHDYGNNYEISYDDFLKMFQSDARAILAVWPSRELAQQLISPDYALLYPPRLLAMDKLESFWMRGADAIYLWKVGRIEDSMILFSEIIESDEFELLPPAYRVASYSRLAQFLINKGETDRAISVLNEKALPLNHNLDEPYSGFTGQINFFKSSPGLGEEKRLFSPYLLLARAYIQKGERAKAAENLKEALKILPENEIRSKIGEKASKIFEILKPLL